MANYDYDFFVIGGGSAGVRAARVAAGYGVRVAVAEERYLGGTCVNVGCVPKKLFVYASRYAGEFQDASGFGWTVGERRFDWTTLIANKNSEIARLNGIYRRVLEERGVEIMDARAILLGPHEIEAAGKIVTADKILIATGGWPTVPEIPGREHAISSNEAFFLERLPARVLIVGGGYIGCEFAGIFHGLGSQVVQIHRGALFLRGFDHDLREMLAREMRKKGVELRFKAEVARLERHEGGVVAELADGGRIESDLVMFATGRAANTANLGLDKAGVAVDVNGAVIVDDYSCTNQPHIYAVGDVTDRLNLTPVAIAEGHAVAETLFNANPTRPDHMDVPSAVFSDPTLASVGLTEEAARRRYGAVTIYRTSFRPLKHTLSGRDEQTMMKLVVDKDSDRVVGIHMVGEEAGEIIQGLAVALKAGATKRDFDRTIAIHPTAAEEFVTMRTPLPEPDLKAAE
jgi:glutathione reductase (NADPH)